MGQGQRGKNHRSFYAVFFTAAGVLLGLLFTGTGSGMGSAGFAGTTGGKGCGELLNSSNVSPELELYRDGFREGCRTGYSRGYQAAVGGNEPYNPYAEVEASGSRRIDGYIFTFGDVKGVYAGYSWPHNDTIKLDVKQLRTAGRLETMCDHEVAHQLFPEFEHPVEKDEMLEDPIYSYSDDMEIEACDRLARNLSN
jgi:hypothetical protein